MNVLILTPCVSLMWFIDCLKNEKYALSCYNSIWYWRYLYPWCKSLNIIWGRSKTKDKVAQLVRCRTSNQRVAGSIPGHSGTLVVLGQNSLFHIASVYPAAKWVPSINKAVLRVCVLYAASCSGISPGGLKWLLYVQCLLGEEGRVSTSVDTRL